MANCQRTCDTRTVSARISVYGQNVYFEVITRVAMHNINRFQEGFSIVETSLPRGVVTVQFDFQCGGEMCISLVEKAN